MSDIKKQENIAYQEMATFMQQGQWAIAERAWEALPAPLQRSARLLHQRGMLSIGQNQLGQAIPYFDEALRLAPKDATLYLSLGNAYLLMRNFKKAIATFDQGIRLNPEIAEFFFNRGTAFRGLGNLGEALKNFHKAAKKNPTFIEAWDQIVITHLDRGEQALALDAAERSLQIDRGRGKSWFNRALVSLEVADLPSARQFLINAVNADPQFMDARLELGLCCLQERNFKEGWPLYETRWRSSAREVLSSLARTPNPKYRGQSEAKRILVWSEQGVGEDILFINLLAATVNFGPDLIVSTDGRLVDLFQRSVNGIHFLSKDTVLDDSAFDAHLPMGDLGLFVDAQRALDQRRLMHAFLKPSPERQHALREKLTFLRPGAPLIGLAWRSKGPRFGAGKSLDLEQLLPLLKMDGFTFVNLQYGPVEDEIADLAARHGVTLHQVEGLDLFQDLEGLAALISLCDGVVSTSNITPHMSGALGKRTCLLRAKSYRSSIWYWRMTEEDRSLWYPSVETLVQSETGQWAEVIERAADRLRAWL